MDSRVRNIIKGTAILAGVLALIYTAAYIYISANKKSIITEIKKQVADKLNGDIQIGDIGIGFLSTFPRISVLLENVSLKDTLYNQHHHPFFEAEKVYANVSLTGLVSKGNPISGIKIEKGQLYVYTDTSGYTNSYLFSEKNKKKQSARGSGNNIDIVKLKDVRLILNNEKKKKLYDFDVAKLNCDINDNDSTLKLNLKSNILIHNLAFNLQNGSFLKEAEFKGNLDLSLKKTLKQLSFKDLTIQLKDHPFNLSGIFDFAKSAFSFTVTSKNLDYNFARSLLTERNAKALSAVKLGKAINNVSAQISGPLNGGDPLVKASWKCENTDVESNFVSFKNATFNGSYINEIVAGLPRKDSNSRLQLQNFTGNWQGLPIKSQTISIDNLTVPVINADIKTTFNLTQFNTLLESSTLDFHSGKGVLDLTFSGPMRQNSNKNTLLNGKLTFSEGTLMYHPRNFELKDVNGNIVFKNTDVFVNDLRGIIQGNKLVMNGSGKNLLALLKTNPGKMFLNWSIYSPSLNLGSFTSLLQKRNQAVRKKNNKTNIGSDIDKIVNQANFNLDIKADKLLFKRFAATNVKASLGIVNENWALNNVSLNHSGGSMIMSGNLNEKNNKYYAANIKVNMQNVDVNKVFYAFDNFGQNGISYQNLRGKLTTTANIRMDIDRSLAGKPQNMEGFVDFSLKKGALLHYKPLENLKDAILTKRNFDEIYFAELKDRFDIKNQEITINRFEIQSSVVTLFVEGVYSLRGNTDISIQIPLSNIKSRDEDYKPENIGANAKAGASIFVRGRPGDDGNIKFKLDLFRKFRKKSDKEKKDDKKEEKKKAEEKSKK